MAKKPPVITGTIQHTEMKDTNPKFLEGQKKIPLANVPPILNAYAAVAFHEGLVKYGAWNWRVGGASAMTYLAACKRHLDLFLEGQEFDPQSGVPHLANALACIGIILDARTMGTLVDDRPPVTAFYADETEQLSAIVRSLTEMHKDKSPIHYSQQSVQESNYE